MALQTEGSCQSVRQPRCARRRASRRRLLPHWEQCVWRWGAEPPGSEGAAVPIPYPRIEMRPSQEEDPSGGRARKAGRTCRRRPIWRRAGAGAAAAGSPRCAGWGAAVRPSVSHLLHAVEGSDVVERVHRWREAPVQAEDLGREGERARGGGKWGAHKFSPSPRTAAPDPFLGFRPPCAPPPWPLAADVAWAVPCWSLSAPMGLAWDSMSAVRGR